MFKKKNGYVFCLTSVSIKYSLYVFCLYGKQNSLVNIDLFAFSEGSKE